MQITYGRTCRVVRTENRASPARSIDQSATRVSATRYGAHAAADHHEGSTGTGASGRFRSTRTACTPFKITTATGKEKTKRNHYSAQDSYNAAHFHPDAGKLLPKSYPHKFIGSAEETGKRSPRLLFFPPSPSSSGGAATGVYERAGLPAPRDILLHQPSAAMNLAWDSRLA